MTKERGMNLITYDTNETAQAIAFFENNIDFLGRIKSVEHKRSRMKSEYKTTITGSEETLVINGGLSSGYHGEGTKGLAKVLVRLGINSSAAESYAKDSEAYKKGFKHDF